MRIHYTGAFFHYSSPYSVQRWGRTCSNNEELFYIGNFLKKIDCNSSFISVLKMRRNSKKRTLYNLIQPGGQLHGDWRDLGVGGDGRRN